MKIIEEYLDIHVSSPNTGRLVQLRFLDKSLYPQYSKVHPMYFTNECSCGECILVFCNCECHNTKKKSKK